MRVDVGEGRGKWNGMDGRQGGFGFGMSSCFLSLLSGRLECSCISMQVIGEECSQWQSHESNGREAEQYKHNLSFPPNSP